METPRQSADGPLCRIELYEPWVAATCRPRTMRAGRGALLAATFRGAISCCKVRRMMGPARRFLARIAGPAEPDRHRDCSTHPDRGRNPDGTGARLRGRHAASDLSPIAPFPPRLRRRNLAIFRQAIRNSPHPTRLASAHRTGTDPPRVGTGSRSIRTIRFPPLGQSMSISWNGSPPGDGAATARP